MDTHGEVRWARIDDEEERAARWGLWSIPGIGFRRFERLLSLCEGSCKSLWALEVSERRRRFKAVGLGAGPMELIEGLFRGPVEECLNAEMARAPAGVSIVHLGDENYPVRLMEIEAPPVFLSILGAPRVVTEARQVAIVGSRKARVEDVTFTERMAAELADAGVIVVSGGALGVDGAAHRGSLAARGGTSVVLPGGLGALAPGSHRGLFERIAEEGGALISEYPAQVKARPYHFRRRNCLIAALADVVVVVRAEVKSGTMLTAEAARDLARPLLVVPGALDDPLAAGCLDLLVRGARAVRHGRDVLSVLSGETECGRRLSRAKSPRPMPERSVSIAPVAPPGLDETTSGVFEKLVEFGRDGVDMVHIDELAQSLKRPVAELGRPLIELELRGCVERVSGASAYRLCH
ncbi:MAG: DNA-processing protein DprA [Bradymonadaceae bacterium]